MDPSHLGGDRQHAQRAGLPARLPPDRQPARRRGPDPGGLRPRLPLAVDVHAGHLRGLAAPHHHQPLPGHGPPQAAHPLRRARRRRGRAAAQPGAHPAAVLPRHPLRRRRAAGAGHPRAGVPRGRRAVRHRGPVVRGDRRDPRRQARHGAQPHPPRPLAPAQGAPAPLARGAGRAAALSLTAGARSGGRGSGAREWSRTILPPAPCEQHLGDRLAALVDGELGHDARERVLAHLATCHVQGGGRRTAAPEERLRGHRAAAPLRGLPGPPPGPPGGGGRSASDAADGGVRTTAGPVPGGGAGRRPRGYVPSGRCAARCPAERCGVRTHDGGRRQERAVRPPGGAGSPSSRRAPSPLRRSPWAVGRSFGGPVPHRTARGGSRAGRMSAGAAATLAGTPDTAPPPVVPAPRRASRVAGSRWRPPS